MTDRGQSEIERYPQRHGYDHEPILYLVLYYGDIVEGKTLWRSQTKTIEAWRADQRVFYSLEAALEEIAQDFPMKTEAGETFREAPDPEDDRIIVWQLIPGKIMYPVWRFSGWHWSDENMKIPQGTLPGDKESLYDLAMR